MSFWAAVQTIAQREEAVGERIKELGYKILTPKARMRIAGRIQIRALFPGYLFVAIIEQWYSVRWSPGVIRLVMAGEQPAKLPDFEIDKIVRATGRNGLVALPKTAPMPLRTRITVGSEVRILTGNFRGCHACYIGQSPQEREMVLLDLFGRKTSTELAPDDRIEAVPAAGAQILPFVSR